MADDLRYHGGVRILTAQEMRNVDQYAISTVGIPGPVLMESAGRSVFAEILKREGPLGGKSIGVLCGNGNNGGDGFVIARYLQLNGATPWVLRFGKGRPKGKDAELNLSILEKMGIQPTEIQQASDLDAWEERIRSADILVDALFGTGLERSLEGVYASAVKFVNQSKSQVYAVDLPSGLHTDSGEAMGAAIRADVTVTFGMSKRGFYLNSGSDLAGDVVVADISLADAWADETQASRVFEIDPARFQSAFPKRQENTHKGTYGHLLVVAGSAEKSGAAVLSSKAALRAGAGLVTLAVPESAQSIVKSQLVEVMTEPLPEGPGGSLGESALNRLKDLSKGKDAVVVGPGLVLHHELGSLLTEWLKTLEIPVVIDADGLNALAPLISTLSPVLKHAILTPHPGEMSRLTGLKTEEIQKDRIEIAKRSSQTWQTTVVLKGAHTVVSFPNGDVYINPTGNPAMATAGMGDVLAGMTGSFLAQGISREEAALAAVYLHGLAGDRVAARTEGRGLLASDLIEELPKLPMESC